MFSRPIEFALLAAMIMFPIIALSLAAADKDRELRSRPFTRTGPPKVEQIGPHVYRDVETGKVIHYLP